MVAHSLAFAEAAEAVVGGPPGEVLDLGSGGGIPGLILADRWAGSQAAFLEGSVRRGRFLEEAAQALGWTEAGRVTVLIGRAEELGRQPEWREQRDLVVARLFGAPAVTVECGGPLVRPGGLLVVSEPPDEAESARQDRWPREVLAMQGLESAATIRRRGFGFHVLRKVQPTPDRYPRRVGIPAKRPLY